MERGAVANIFQILVCEAIWMTVDQYLDNDFKYVGRGKKVRRDPFLRNHFLVFHNAPYVALFELLSQFLIKYMLPSIIFFYFFF